jgi:6,7-dimethyl-8-ribityllumazine synthase
MAGRISENAIHPVVAGQRFAVVAARFNEAISEKLLEGAREAFSRHRVPDGSVEVHWVPGSFELPQAALALARTGRFAGIVCLGVVIKGETPHFDYVARAASEGIGRAALETGVPISFGVITALTAEQAWARAGGAVGNRGSEAALAALEMAGWLHAVGGTRGSARNGRSPSGRASRRKATRSKGRAK